MKRITVLSAALILAASAFNLTYATEASAYGWNGRMSDDWDQDDDGGAQAGRRRTDRWGDSLFDERGGYGYGYGRGYRRHSGGAGWGGPCSGRSDSVRAGELWHDRMINADERGSDVEARRARIRRLLAQSMGVSDGGDAYDDAGMMAVGDGDLRDLILDRIRKSGDPDRLLDKIKDRIAGDDDE